MDILAFFHQLIVREEGKSLLAATVWEATNSVFFTTDENKSFSITTPGHLTFEDGDETINKLNERL